jgi:hypothetical protein
MLYLCTSTYNKIHALTNDIGQPNHNHRLISDSKVVGPHRNTSIRRYPKELKALVTNKVCKYSPLTNNYTIYNTGLISPLPWFPRIHQLRRCIVNMSKMYCTTNCIIVSTLLYCVIYSEKKFKKRGCTPRVEGRVEIFKYFFSIFNKQQKDYKSDFHIQYN